MCGGIMLPSSEEEHHLNEALQFYRELVATQNNLIFLGNLKVCEPVPLGSEFYFKFKFGDFFSNTWRLAF